MDPIRVTILATGLVALLASCDSSGENPFDNPTSTDETTVDPDDSTTDADETEDGIDSDGELPPGTANPTPSDSIVRYEPDGTALNYAYDSKTDTFQIDNLPFDGDSEGRSDYLRDNQVASLGNYAVYEATSPAIDAVDGSEIAQLQYKAIYGVSPTRQTEFAIVRTGSYVDYGFGGFVYQRNGGVTIPTTGQADYNGTYAGLRDFEGTANLEYVQGSAWMAIDFEDFNSGDGVRLRIEDRRVFDLAGNDITDSIVSALDGTSTELPVLQATISPDVATENGELFGSITSDIVTESGLEELESGNFYAVVADDNASEIVGIVVVESTDPRYDSVTVRETGGFIVYRDQ